MQYNKDYEIVEYYSNMELRTTYCRIRRINNSNEFYNKRQKRFYKNTPVSQDTIFANKGAAVNALKAYLKRNKVDGPPIIGEVYENGQLWLVGYHTGHKNGTEVEFTNQTFTNVRSAKNWIANNLARFNDLILFSTSLNNPLEIVETYELPKY